MKFAFATVAFLVMAWCGLDAAAQDGSIAVKVRRWQAEIKGDIQVDDDNIGGTAIDVDDTFGFDDKEDFDELHLTMGLPLLGRFNFQYLKGGFEGTRTLSTDITFAGTTFTVGTTIDAELDFEAYTLLWQFGASTPGVIGADVGAGAIAGIKYFDIHAEARDAFTGTSDEVRVRAPLPVVGAYVRTNLGKMLSVEAQVHGIKFFDNLNLGLSGIFYDATIAIDAKFSGVFAGVGYRLMHMDVQYEDGTDADIQLDINGIFFEAGLSF
jgi:hypothetical protein